MYAMYIHYYHHAIWNRYAMIINALRKFVFDAYTVAIANPFSKCMRQIIFNYICTNFSYTYTAIALESCIRALLFWTKYKMIIHILFSILLIIHVALHKANL